MRARLLLLAAALAVAVVTGCGEPKQLTLREAEEIGQLWLDDLRGFLEPKRAPVATAESEAEATKPEEGPVPGPKVLRDCFVDDGWDPAGFPNPTAVVDWLTSSQWKVGRMTSAELVDGATELDFQLSGQKDVMLHARVVVEGQNPKCQSLKKSE